MFVLCPFVKERCWLYTYAGRCTREHLDFVRRADIVDYGKYCIGKARSKIPVVIWEEERIFAVHIGILKTRRRIELNDCTSCITEG